MSQIIRNKGPCNLDNIPEKAIGQEYRPKERILACFPSWLLPYAELARIQQPLGFYQITCPFIVGVAYMITTSVFLNRVFLLSLWSIFFRSAGCAWDDIVDMDVDRQIARTKVRPLPRGAVSTWAACVFTVAVYASGSMFLVFLPWRCTIDALVMTFSALLYPFGKRLFDYPQLIMGNIGWAIPMAMHSLDMDPLAYPAATSCMFLYFSVVIVMVDIIYAIQDVEEDIKVGVKSMAVRFRESLNFVISLLFYASSILLAGAGVTAKLGIPFFILSLGGHAIRKPSSDAEQYARFSGVVGSSFLIIGLVIEYCLRPYSIIQLLS
ncbi:UbiA prenyltransferase family-domain-containing protein [Talaromyces proteolyticus]|uniref:UbiA prenyltransferase family-domain-containing protein n=1 Tax=Talaromyces proteolyticus TaxID=1131652 RepID=A0AAD4KIJ0_9EURO|nr:UbiA prenyltransferase family-domain-containing protein [Talaromyces proteolyticus]KAH8691173.1 UbiA prenyltransferase family-domain-containing protein [Talaromyces proteolyticus]